jgi:hypothetical protein
MLTILVIEDHVITLESICLILKKQGYEALAAKNAQEAQEHFFENKVHLEERACADAFQRPGMVGKPEAVDVLLPKPVSVPILLASIEGLFARRAADSAVAQD